MADDRQSDPQEGGGGDAPPWQRTLYACWVAQLLSIIGFSFVMPFIPFYVRELGVSGEAQVAIWSGLVITAAGLMQAIFAPIWGHLADRYGRKIMVERAMFGGAVAMTLMGMVANVHQLFVLRMIQGALTGTVVASTTLVASISPQRRMGYSLGMMQVAVLMGVTIGPWVGGLAADAYGYRVPFYAAGVFLLLGGIVVLALAHEEFCVPEEARGARNHGLQSAFGARGLVALLATFFMISIAGSFVGPIFPLLVEQISQTGRAASAAGMLMGVAGLAAGASALLIGLLGDRLGHKPLLVACTWCAALFSAPHALAQTIGQLLALRVGMGLARGGTAPALNAIVGQAVSSDTYGRAFGNTRVASAMGMALGPLAGGFAAAHLGLRWPFVLMSGMLALTAVGIARWVRPSIIGAADAARRAGEDGSQAAT
ncbi:MAG: MFS transporter [Armatimonadota bacterium]